MNSEPGMRVPDAQPQGCECGQSDEWHTDEAHRIEDQVGYEALADFEAAHDFEYTS